MSQSFTSNLPPLTIPSGSANSNSMSFAEFSDATAVTLYGPAALDALTFTLEISRDGSTWVTSNDGTSDIGPPAAVKGRQYTEFLGANYVRIHASGNVAADRTWTASKQWTA